ncbi:Uu.00g011880.m01.CDS01 [Anthostomella pinea]|uniref:Uu.00g011880.m01.CDS01 n=1 Tax=Anthostomella pinea TaxID=933095 RepID=A0AAI8YQ21_9PEZI|nr:Uu.00g011880.m01.CDS01 [Anthostomella pinea]
MTAYNDKKPFDLIKRGEKAPTPAGTLTFTTLRLLDLPIQHALLTLPAGLGIRLLSSLGLTAIASLSAPGSTLFHTGLPFLDNLAGSGVGIILLAMACGSAAKQIYWQLRLSQESFPPAAATAVSFYNTLVNSANSLLFMALATTSLRSQPLLSIPLPNFISESNALLPASVVIGTALYVTGLTIETLAEHQRAQFKARPENKGKVCKQGLWSWARHVNYFGYSLWRGGYCMVASGWVGGLAMGLFQGWDLSQRAVATLDAYCSDRYGQQWRQFKMEVPYRIVPGVY